jgi:hypothetical protein
MVWQKAMPSTVAIARTEVARADNERAESWTGVGEGTETVRVDDGPLFRDTLPSSADAALRTPSLPTIAVSIIFTDTQFDDQRDSAGVLEMDTSYRAIRRRQNVLKIHFDLLQVRLKSRAFGPQ